MVSLINHEYSRREAHGRFAWQFMLSNAPEFSCGDQLSKRNHDDVTTISPGTQPQRLR